MLLRFSFISYGSLYLSGGKTWNKREVQCFSFSNFPFPTADEVGLFWPIETVKLAQSLRLGRQGALSSITIRWTRLAYFGNSLNLLKDSNPTLHPAFIQCPCIQLHFMFVCVTTRRNNNCSERLALFQEHIDDISLEGSHALVRQYCSVRIWKKNVDSVRFVCVSGKVK